jgi:hypothetical protein
MRLLTHAPVGKRLEWAAPGHAAAPPGAALNLRLGGPRNAQRRPTEYAADLGQGFHLENIFDAGFKRPLSQRQRSLDLLHLREGTSDADQSWSRDRAPFWQRDTPRDWLLIGSGGRL